MVYSKSKKKISVIFIILLLVLSTTLSIMFYTWGLIIPCLYYLLISAFSFYVFGIIWNYKSRLDFVQLVHIVLYPHAVLFFISNIIFWKVIPFHIVWGGIFPLASLFLHNLKKTIYISVSSIISVTLAPFISHVSGVSDSILILFKILSKNQLLIANYFEIYSFIIVLTILTYQFYLHNEAYIENKIAVATELHLPEAEPKQEILSSDAEPDSQLNTYDIKLTRIYQSMISHIEAEKLYTNPEFRLEDLAKIVGTNRSYASAALNKQGKTFNNFINSYRIEHAKKELQNNTKSMREIYIEAGFKYHSTFLKVFEELVGVKPSQYQYIQDEPK